MALDIIATKLFKEPKETIKKSVPKYRCNLTFKSKAFDFTNIPKILKLKEVCKNLPSNFDISDSPMVFIISIPLLDPPFLKENFTIYNNFQRNLF